MATFTEFAQRGDNFTAEYRVQIQIYSNRPGTDKYVEPALLAAEDLCEQLYNQNIIDYYQVNERVPADDSEYPRCASDENVSREEMDASGALARFGGGEDNQFEASYNESIRGVHVLVEDAFGGGEAFGGEGYQSSAFTTSAPAVAGGFSDADTTDANGNGRVTVVHEAMHPLIWGGILTYDLAESDEHSLATIYREDGETRITPFANNAGYSTDRYYYCREGGPAIITC